MTIKDPTVLSPIEMTGPDASLLCRWRGVARQLADLPAVHSPGLRYTFGETEALSDAIGTAMVARFSEGTAPVGALLGHDARALIGFLSIVKAGRIVVMLDPHLPTERLRDIIVLAGITTVVADAANEKHLSALGLAVGDLGNTGMGGGIGVVMLDLLFAEAEAEAEAEAQAQAQSNTSAGAGSDAARTAFSTGEGERTGQDALSIIFTSGSTGKPKGVIHSHAQMLNDAGAHSARYTISAGDRIALVLPIGFSAGLSLMFIALLNGASLWMFDPRDGGTRGLIRWINDNRLTMFHCTPYLLRSVSETLVKNSLLPTLRVVSTVGEAVFEQDVEAIRPHLHPAASFINWVGSSETGTFALFHLRGDEAVPTGSIPAGIPTANKDVRLIREDGSLAKCGEPGEVLIFSHYLSGGYWGAEGNDESRFTLDEDGRRGCRQGDLGRFDENGNLQLLGRADAAVKVRGYLVEPSEIEAAFLATELIQEVAVIAIVDAPAPTRLVAYLVPRSGIRPPSAAALRRELRKKLPEYMVPSVIFQLGVLPRNERGKVDRSRLPSVAPRGESQEPLDQWQFVVAGIWRGVLELPSIDLDDDFMALGGDSLSTEELLSTVQSELGIEVVSSDLMDFPTLREFARRLKQGSAALPSHPDVVTLRADGSQTPMFCFAGSGALALTFLPMSHHFDDRAIYAFQAHGLEARGIPDWSIEASAKRFLQIMRIVRPHGPYLLVGHSFGGLIALEIAKVLEKAGETVELVALLDTYYPSSLHEPPNHDFGVIAAPVVQKRVPVAAVIAARDFALGGLHRVLPDGLPGLNLWTRRLRGHLAGILRQTGQRQFDAFFDHGTIVARRYQLQPYSGRSFVVFANDNPDRKMWQKALTTSSTFVDIVSEHSSMLREPHAAEVSRLLQHELAEIQSDQRMPAAE